MTTEREQGRRDKNIGSDGRNPHQGVDLARQIAEIAHWQGGHVTRKQLYRVGLSSRAVDHRVMKGELIRVQHGVYAVGHLPTTPKDRAHGALLATGERSALAGRTALAFWRNDRDWPDELELVSVRDIRLTGLTIRHTKTLLQRDIRAVQGLRVTSPARTALDVAALVGATRPAGAGAGAGAEFKAGSWGEDLLTANELTGIVNDLRHINKLKVHQLRDVVKRNPRHPGTKHLREVIGDAQAQPTRSQLENAFRKLIKRYKLPIPLMNVRVGGVEVDAYYPDHQLIVELDGRVVTHADDWRPAFENDRARMVKVMAKTGIPTIRFTWDQITRLHAQTARDLKAILDARLDARLQAGARTP
jgi:very-short-patch-repair endonuclease